MKFAITDLTADELHACLEVLKVKRAPIDVGPSPATASPSVSSTPAAPDLDARGVPHHPEFHAPGKGKTKAGNWARKKGVDQDACDAYEKQFAATTNAPGLPALPGLPPLPGLPAPGVSYPPVDFNTFANLYSQLASAGVVSGDDVNRIMRESGVSTLEEWGTNDKARAHAFGLLSTIKASSGR